MVSNPQRITFEAVPDEGYRFFGWAGECSGNEHCSVTAANDQIVSAIFVPMDVGASLYDYAYDIGYLTLAPRYGDDAHRNDVRDMCADRLADLGFDVELYDFTGNITRFPGTNVVGKIPGDARPDEVVYVSAHYDSTKDCIGANDNASGLAGIFEVARLLSLQAHDRTLKVACWDLEETGLEGSKDYMAWAGQEDENIIASYVFDMIGYYREEPFSQKVPRGLGVIYPDQYAWLAKNGFKGNFITLIYDDAGSFNPAGSTESVAWFKKAASGVNLTAVGLPVRPLSSDVLSDLFRSDHVAFRDQQYPSILITDTAEFRNPNYHCEGGEDSPETLNYLTALSVVEATVVSALMMLDK